MIGVRVPPAVLLAAAGTTQYVLARRGHRPGKTRTTAALTVATASLGLLGVTVARFRRDRTTVDPVSPEKTSSLIVDGPNQLSRNPMYVGMAGLLLAHSIYHGSLLPYLPAAGFVLAIDRLQIPLEEKALLQKFDSEFLQYQSEVPRWLGFQPWLAHFRTPTRLDGEVILPDHALNGMQTS